MSSPYVETYKYTIPPEIVAVGGPPPRVAPEFRLFGLFTSPNHIRDWRHMKFLLVAEKALSATPESKPDFDTKIDLRLGSGRAAGRASTFIPSEGVHRFSDHVQNLSRFIGLQSFQAAYNSPPPPELVDYVISDENKQRYIGWNGGPQLEQVTIEALHGRIAWEDRFAEAGVPSPEEYIETAANLYVHSDAITHYEGYL